MVIEIPRAFLVKEPWTTAAIGGKLNTRPMVVSIPQGNELAAQINAAPDGVSTFRVIDNMGPCYEFEGKAQMLDDVLTVHVEGTLKFLR